MSVDTIARGKNLSPYEAFRYDGVEFLLPRNLLAWAADLKVDAKRSVFGKRFVVSAEHAHGPG